MAASRVEFLRVDRPDKVRVDDRDVGVRATESVPASSLNALAGPHVIFSMIVGMSTLPVLQRSVKSTPTAVSSPGKPLGA